MDQGMAGLDQLVPDSAVSADGLQVISTTALVVCGHSADGCAVPCSVCSSRAERWIRVWQGWTSWCRTLL